MPGKRVHPRFFATLAAAAMLLPIVAACAPSSTPAKPTEPAKSDAAKPADAKPAAPAAPAPAAPVAAPAAAPKAEGSPAAAAKPAENVKRGGTVRIGTYQEPIVLNPLLGSQTINNLVSRNIIEGLAQPLPDGTYGTGLAAEIPTLQNGGVTPDGLTVTWKLKPGVTWSDGKPLTSKDVVFTYNVVMDPANPIAIRSGYPDIASVTATGDTTVVVKYKQIYGAYREHFDWIIPEHVFGGTTAIEKHEFNRAPVGTGPFKFKGWASGDNIAMDKNPNYREQGKPYVDGLIFKITPSREAAVQALKVGELDALWNLAESNIPEFDQMQDVVMQPQARDRVERLVMNASCNSGPQMGDAKCPHPVLGDVRVRQAIDLAIDKKAMVDKLLYGKTTVASSTIPVGWYAPKLDPSEYNPNKAKQLLEEAGWKPGPDGIRVKEGVRAKLEYGTTTGDRLREQTQQVIQEMLKGVGIEVEIKNTPSAVLLGGWADNAPRAKGNFDILMWTTNAGLDPQAHLQSYFHSSQIPTEQTRSGRNYHRIVDPELDKAIDAAGATVDEKARIASYKTVAERVNAGKGHTVLYNRLQLDALKKYVKGYAWTIWSDFTWDTENWWLDK